MTTWLNAEVPVAEVARRVGRPPSGGPWTPAGARTNSSTASPPRASAAPPLPHPLAYTIKDTAQTHGQLKVVRSACCIRSDDTALIAEVAQSRALAKLRLRRIAPTVLISTAPPEETLSALRTAGYAPSQEAETGSTLLDRAPTDRAPSLLPTLDPWPPPERQTGPRRPGERPRAGLRTHLGRLGGVGPR
ncbi:helicase-associated domain-containing protein [Streptomyces sp. NPDC054840]